MISPPNLTPNLPFLIISTAGDINIPLIFNIVKKTAFFFITPKRERELKQPHSPCANARHQLTATSKHKKDLTSDTTRIDMPLTKGRGGRKRKTLVYRKQKGNDIHGRKTGRLVQDNTKTKTPILGLRGILQQEQAL